MLESGIAGREIGECFAALPLKQLHLMAACRQETFPVRLLWSCGWSVVVHITQLRVLLLPSALIDLLIAGPCPGEPAGAAASAGSH